MRWIKDEIKSSIKFAQTFIWQIRPLYNSFFTNRLIKQNKKIHLGCGNIRFDNFINIDNRPTPVTDLVKDCSKLNFLPNKSINIIYANAFLEHLYLLNRQKFIEDVYRVLTMSGKAIILSIPDFEIVSKAYLGKQKFNKEKLFDLYQAYRFTHGEPEQSPNWWIGQLHKSLFDTKTLKILFENAGFPYFIIFRYSFSRDLVAVNLGIIAYKRRPKRQILRKREIGKIFREFNLEINNDTIELLYSASNRSGR